MTDRVLRTETGKALSNDEAREIARLLATGTMTQAAIARLYGVGETAIWRIKAGQRAHLALTGIDKKEEDNG